MANAERANPPPTLKHLSILKEELCLTVDIAYFWRILLWLWTIAKNALWSI